MELFSEIYSLYFRAVENVLRLAEKRPLIGGELQKTLSESTFSESTVAIMSKLKSGEWRLLRRTDKNYEALCIQPEKVPLTVLQRAWIKTLLQDSKIRLFLSDDEIEKLQSDFSDADTLYQSENFYIFDQAADKDDYADTGYQTVFKTVLQAIHNKSALFIQYNGGKGKPLTGIFKPFRLEYSQKDDKFRVHCQNRSNRRNPKSILNMARIKSAKPVHSSAGDYGDIAVTDGNENICQITFEITKERNALDRCMVHFAHFEKKTEYDEKTDKYICTLNYSVMNETEVLIRILSFGPTVKVISPDSFIEMIKSRVKRQSELIAEKEINFQAKKNNVRRE